MFKRLVNAVEVLALVASGLLVLLMLFYRPPAPAPAPAAAGSGGSPAAVGAALYRTNCAGCHGAAGGGGTGPKLGGGALATRGVDAVTAVVTNGRGSMPAWEGSLSESQIEAVVQYIVEDL